MKKAIFIVLTVCVLLSLPVGWYIRAVNTPPPNLSQDFPPLTDENLWSLIQEWRTDNGFQPYTKDQNLCRIAKERVNYADDGHAGFIASYSHGEYPSTLSENQQKGARDAFHSLQGWLNSPPHRKALEHDYKYSCVVTKDRSAVQIFSNCEYKCP